MINFHLSFRNIINTSKDVIFSYPSYWVPNNLRILIFPGNDQRQKKANPLCCSTWLRELMLPLTKINDLSRGRTDLWRMFSSSECKLLSSIGGTHMQRFMRLTCSGTTQTHCNRDEQKTHLPNKVLPFPRKYTNVRSSSCDKRHQRCTIWRIAITIATASSKNQESN